VSIAAETADPRSHQLRISYVALLSLTLLFYAYEELHLRRWLFHHLGRNSVIAGSLPNFLAVVLLSLAVMAVRLPLRSRNIIRTIAAIVVGLSLYEVAQIWLPHQVFDWNDLAATVFGGIFAWTLILIPWLAFRSAKLPSQPSQQQLS
jgi:hypothetical protein